MIKKFKDIKISGISLVLPPKEISIYDELQYYGNSEKKRNVRTGWPDFGSGVLLTPM